MRSSLFGLIALLMSPLSMPTAAEDNVEEGEKSVGRVTFYSARKAIRANDDIVCELRADTLWRKSLKGKAARDNVRGKRCRNDAARSVMLDGPIARGTRIQVFNSASGRTTKPGDSSWAEIVLRTSLPARASIMIGSFEQAQQNSAFSVRSQCNVRRRGGRGCPFGKDDYLDGKVSWISILPPGSEAIDVPVMEADGSEAR